MKRKTIMWTAVIGVVLVAAAAYGFRWLAEDEAATAPSVATTEVRRGDLAVSVSGTGSIRPSDQTNIKSGKDGTIAEVLVLEGSKVSKGEILITLEREEAVDASRQIRSKELQIEQLELELTELQNRFKSAADESERDNARLGIAKQQLNIEIAREELAELLEDDEPGNEEDYVIRADIDGMVTELDAAAGDQIKAGAALGAIVNYDILHMVASIDELDITKIAIGQEADLYVEALPGEEIGGRVVDIAREGVAQNGVASYDVTIEVLDNNQLKPGMSAEAAIQVEKKENILLLPVDAVASIGGSYFVTVMRETVGVVAQSGNKDRMEEPSTDREEADDGTDGSESSGQDAALRGEAAPPMRSEGSNDGESSLAQRANRFAAEGRGLPAATPDHGTGHRIQIEAGIANEDYIEIVSGLSEGDTVILPNAPVSGQHAFPSGTMSGERFPGGGSVGARGGGVFGGVRP
ncbi:hemolysin D [Xylanibacillus composti]|uniref:Hemolysin D n=1 Tax=Xylanibacillus composti TaxID=1572762 RepID=A0A8J4H6V7_9BACL|nr:efflux RND transporter periplasmic adaptor subunit [Xylanibacillus composti]GIQ69588.1 hemolysin D [Xylanibacillus composti]